MAIIAEQVFAAANTIAATGKAPTVAAVRAHLGTGSFATITPMLREWKETQTPSTATANPIEPVPQPLTDCFLSVVPQIWAIASSIAHDQLSIEREVMNVERNELQTALADSTATGEIIAADLEAVQVQLVESAAVIDRLKTDHAASLEIEIKARIIAEQDGASLRATNVQMQTRLDELYDMNNELKTAIGLHKSELKDAQADIESLKTAIDSNKADHATALDAQKAITYHAESRATAAEAISAAQATQITYLQNTITSLKEELAAQVKEANAAEKRATIAEATLAAHQQQPKMKTVYKPLKK